MPQFVGGPGIKLRTLIDLFCGMGCVLGEVPGALEDDDGDKRFVRYLYNPDSDAFVSLYGLEDDDRVPPLTVESWERTLGVEIPKGGRN